MGVEQLDDGIGCIFVRASSKNFVKKLWGWSLESEKDRRGFCDLPDWDAAGNTYELKEAFHLLATLLRGASSGVIPSWLELCLRVRVRADFRDARAAEAIPHL
jgi:hypothetical protein